MNIEDQINISAPRIHFEHLILSTDGDRYSHLGGYIVVLYRTLKQ